MCVPHKTQHSFTLYLSILYLYLVPHRPIKEAEIVSKCKHRQSHYDFPNTDSKKISTWVSLLKTNYLLAKLCFL